jgi:glutamate dehydrogenase/leucine dehydrogenase
MLHAHNQAHELTCTQSNAHTHSHTHTHTHTHTYTHSRTHLINRYVVEAANMPCTNEASAELIENGVAFGPAKAANAGGVSVSGLEMAQQSQRVPWTRDEVDAKLLTIMKDIHGVR